MTAILTELADLFTQSVVVEPRTGADAYGVATYGTPVTYACRMVGRRQQVINASGQVVESNQTIYLRSADAVDPRARVTLSTGDVGSTEDYAVHPSILAVGRYPDEADAGYTALFL